ncbi:MAG: hypothetical protein HYS32_03970 [Candidatus Woesearchaeota archaeon]|nr:MAG: hypothetical protein HYS32_03970 [Candidatus Woesearchaeota archaeon]
MKGQISLETLFAVVIVLVAVGSIMAAVAERKSSVEDTEEFLEQRDFCLKLSNDINSVFTNGDGATVKVSKTPYNAFFDGPSREIWVENARCSMPISSITNGINNSFVVSKGLLQMENRDNTVYISSNCIINAPVYAETAASDSNISKVVTNLVKKDDDKYAEINVLGHKDENNKNLYQGNAEVNIAYLRLGQHCTQSNLQELLDEYQCKDYDEDVGVTKCDIFYNENVIRDEFFGNSLYEEYDIYIIEDVQNSIGDNEAKILENETKEGKWMFFSGRFGSSGVKFGINYWTNKGDAPATVKNYTDEFFQLDAGKQYYGTKKNMAATKNNSVGSYVQIADFKNNYDAMSRWDYGDGDVYFISDICEDDIPDKLKLAIERIIRLLNGGWLYAEFELVPLINALSVESSEIGVSHKASDASVYIANITYRTTGDWKQVCSGLPSGVTEVSDNCDLQGYSGEEELDTIVSFNTNEKGSTKKAYVDVEYIRVCYNDTVNVP